MATPLIINTNGSSTISRKAERAIVDISVSSSGPDKSTVSTEVISTSKHIQSELKALAPKSETGEPTAEAAITHWSMSTLWTSFYTRYPDDNPGYRPQDNGAPKPKPEKVFTAQTSFTLKFADFAKLGAVCTDLAEMEHVSIRNIAWSLTDDMKASLVSESRRMAVDDAVAKAKDFAAAVGMQSVKAVEINGQGYGGDGRGDGYGIAYRAAPLGLGRPESEQLDFEPEDVELTCSVGVKFEAE